ncbi:MAG: HEAT repeat domain-containing protein [Promethearchaeota archaeon]
MSTKPEILPEILANLQSNDVSLKKQAIFKAGEKKLVETIPIMISLLQDDSDSVVRNSSARALGKLYGADYKEEILESLIQALQDEDYYVKANACWGLGKTKEIRAIPYLMEMVDPNQRFYAAAGDAQTQKIIPESEASTKLKEEGVKFSDVIVGAIKALGNMKDPQGVPALIKALDDEADGNVRCAACLALGKIKDNSAVPALIDLLKREKYWYVRRDIIKALMKIKDPRAIDELVKKTSDTYDEVREFAFKALIAIGKPAGAQIFKLFLSNPENSMLKRFITETLSKEDLKAILIKMLAKESDPALKEKYQLFLDQFI